MRLIALFLMSIASALSLPALSQDAPGRVGRIAYVSGPVSVFQDPDQGWDKAYVNTPITSENSIWTDRGARAEMRVGGTAIRLDGETQLDVNRLDDEEIDASIEQGSVNIRARYMQRGDRYIFSTPHARFLLEGDGRYRIDVDREYDESTLTVFAGTASMETSGGRVRVPAGSTIVVYGAAGQYVTEKARTTAFDRWATTRDSLWRDSVSRQYVPSDMTGYEDLERYGSWVQEPDYGAIWFPTTVSSTWAPYREGHWTHVRPWGWTWVDDQPWGYAPSHYGRWVQVRNRWGWVPGRRTERAVWAPAVVGFIGGSNWSIGVTSGRSAPVVGWYPLAPWERYEPWYRTNSSYNTRINVVVVDRAPRSWQGRGDDWRRWNRDRGTTVVQRDAMANRRPVQQARVQVTQEAIRQQPVVAATQVTQVLPQRNPAARFGEGQQAQVAAPTVSRQRPAAQREPQQQARPQGGEPARPAQAPAQQGQNQVVRPEFSRRAAPAAIAPAPANQPPPQATNPAARGDTRAREEALKQREAQREAATKETVQREAQQQQEQAARTQREAQQREGAQQQQRSREAQQQQEQQQRTTREAQQQEQQQRTTREAAQQQQRAQEQQQRESAQQQQKARDAQQQQERAAREAQQQRETQTREAQQRDTQQREAAQQQQRTREAQQAKEATERAQREAQQQQQQQRGAQQQREAQERQAREAQQQQQKAREAQAAQERAQREAQQQQQQQQQQRAAQEKAQREAQQQQGQRAAQEKAQRDAQQQQQQQQQRAAQEKAQREAQQQQRAAPPPPAQPPAASPAARPERDTRTREQREKDAKEKAEKEKAEKK